MLLLAPFGRSAAIIIITTEINIIITALQVIQGGVQSYLAGQQL